MVSEPLLQGISSCELWVSFFPRRSRWLRRVKGLQFRFPSRCRRSWRGITSWCGEPRSCRLFVVHDGSASLMDLLFLRLQQSRSRRVINLNKMKKIRTMSGGLKKTNNFLHIFSLQWPKKFWSSVWTAISEMFSLQSKSRILQIRSQLSREKKGDSSAAAYYSKMKSISDENR